MALKTPLLLLFAVAAFGQTAPTIANVTNAAIPDMDFPANSVALAPGSMATIFGTNLADTVSSAPSPWQKSLAGIEVHFAEDTCFDSGCELVADLIYVSPTQINFVVPSVALYPDPQAHVWKTRVVLVKNGVRFDDRTRMIGGPGRVYIDAVYGYADLAVFGVGYDCLYSFKSTDPGACGLSWFQGQHRAMLGAITDAMSGQLITTANPARQGQLLTFWMTGLTGDPFFQNPTSFCFGVAQQGNDIQGQWCAGSNSPSMAGLWSGKSPEFPGLDQANVKFPVCTGSAVSAEKRYDVWLEFSGNPTVSQVSHGTIVRIYLPFSIAQGDHDCGWVAPANTLTLTSTTNPSVVGVWTPFKVCGLPSIPYAGLPAAIPGSGLTIFDGTTPVKTSADTYTVFNSCTTFNVGFFSEGTHNVSAHYNGDATHSANTSNTVSQVVSAPVTITLKSTPNPSSVSQSVSITATVSPAAASGTVTFSEYGCYSSCTLKTTTVPLNGGTATFSTSTLSAGDHIITASYSGDAVYAAVASPVNTLRQTVK